MAESMRSANGCRAFLCGIDEDGLGIGTLLAADHVGYDADFAGRDAVIFEGCGDHDSRE